MHASTNLLGLLLKAALKKPNYRLQFGPDDLPIVPAFDNSAIDLDVKQMPIAKITAFHRLVNWTDNKVVHPCFLQVLAFPLHLMLMTRQEFPFKLLGLIHLTNQISQYRPVAFAEKLQIHCFIANIFRHPKGWAFTIQTEVRVAKELCWQARSVNLYRYNWSPSLPAVNHHYASQPTLHGQQSWQLSHQLGWHYARLSGDYNPIHLSLVSAKLLGLKRHIAHGMWSKARCLSAVQQIAPGYFTQALSVKTRFNQPIFLPATLNFRFAAMPPTEPVANLDFSLSSLDNRVPHLTGVIEAI